MNGSACIAALVVAGIASGAGGLEGSASAYVRSRTTHSTPTHWASSCVFVQPASAGSPDLDPALTFATIKSALAAWTTATQSCSYLALQYVEPASVDAHFDGTNVIKFRTDKWCHPDDDQSQGVCYTAIAAGITTVFYVDRPGSSDDGRILDADVELNDLNFTFDLVDPVAGESKQPRAGTSIADFENTLVHELGHLQGLDHTCKDSATPAVEVDENGNPPPGCTSLQLLTVEARAKITEATMFNSAEPSETKKRSPEADDVAGICAAYPIATPASSCAPADLSGYGKKAGCDQTGSASAGAPFSILLLFGILALCARRRVA